MQSLDQKKIKHVTNRNGVQFAGYARDFGVPRENFVNFMNNEEKRKKFFQEIIGDPDWFKKLQIEAEKIGGRVHLISNLVVDYTMSHNDAAMAGGPQTGSGYDVLKVADKYEPSVNKKTTEIIILFNWPKGGGNYQKTVEWGLQNGLLKTTPHVPFAIGDNFPKLNYELGPNPMYVVETTGCSFVGRSQACCVYWDDAKRNSSLFWQSSFGYSNDWFAFRR